MAYDDWIVLTKEDGKKFHIRKSVIIEFREDRGLKGNPVTVIKDMNGITTAVVQPLTEVKELLTVK